MLRIVLCLLLLTISGLAQPVNPPRIVICTHESYEDRAYYLSLPKNSAERRLLRGVAYHKRAQYSKAIKEYRAGLELEPDDHRLHFHLGGAYFAPRNHKKAIRHFRRALQLKPGMYFCRGWMSVSLRMLGRREEADDEMALARSIVPQTSREYRYRAQMLFFSGQTQQALEYANGAIKKFPEKGPYMVRGRAHLFFKDYQKAVDDFSSHLKSDPNYAWAYKRRAQAYDILGEKAKAKADRAEFDRLNSVVLD